MRESTKGYFDFATSWQNTLKEHSAQFLSKVAVHRAGKTRSAMSTHTQQKKRKDTSSDSNFFQFFAPFEAFYCSGRCVINVAG